jgi:hypothetical protein
MWRRVVWYICTDTLDESTASTWLWRRQLPPKRRFTLPHNMMSRHTPQHGYSFIVTDERILNVVTHVSNNHPWYLHFKQRLYCRGLWVRGYENRWHPLHVADLCMSVCPSAPLALSLHSLQRHDYSRIKMAQLNWFLCLSFAFIQGPMARTGLVEKQLWCLSTVYNTQMFLNALYSEGFVMHYTSPFGADNRRRSAVNITLYCITRRYDTISDQHTAPYNETVRNDLRSTLHCIV